MVNKDTRLQTCMHFLMKCNENLILFSYCLPWTGHSTQILLCFVCSAICNKSALSLIQQQDQGYQLQPSITPVLL